MTDPRPPLEPEASSVLLITPDSAEAGINELMVELPEPGSLAAGSWVALAGSPRQSGFFARFSRRGAAGIALSIRCTALLAKGYCNVCADESGVAYGQVPGSDTAAFRREGTG